MKPAAITLLIALAWHTGLVHAQERLDVAPHSAAFDQRTFPLGEVPAGARVRALQQIEASKAGRPPVSGNGWESIGPAPVAQVEIQESGSLLPFAVARWDMSGPVTSITVHPTDPNHWLVGTAQGGVWQTRDAGQTWVPLTDDQASLAIGAVAFARSDPSIVYAGTGEANFQSDAYAGAGLLRSVDGGASWSLLGARTFGNSAFSDVKVHPSDPSTVVVATTRGGAPVAPTLPSRGIFRSTDRGVSWSLRLPGEATDLEIDPTDFRRQYAGIGDPGGSPENGVYRTMDGGITWSQIPGPWNVTPPVNLVGRVELAVSPSDPNVVFVGIGERRPLPPNSGDFRGLYRTDNAWAASPTWIQIAYPVSPFAVVSGTGYCNWDPIDRQTYGFGTSSGCWSHHELIVDPNDSNTLYAGGWNLDRCMSCGLTPVVARGLLSFRGIHALAWAGPRLIVGGDGGVWTSPDPGAISSHLDHNWVSQNTSLAIAQFNRGALHPANGDFVALAGIKGMGTVAWTGMGARSWAFKLNLYFQGGVTADPTAAEMVAHAISPANPDRHWVGSYANCGWETTDGGTSIPRTCAGPFQLALWDTLQTCSTSPTVPVTGLVGGSTVWVDADLFDLLGPSALLDLQAPGVDPSFPVRALAAPPGANCGVVAAGTDDGRLLIRPDPSVPTGWRNLDPGNQVPDRAVTDVAFHPADPNVLYVTLSGFDEGTPNQPGHLFKTTNALAVSPTWTNVSPPVNIPHNRILLDPGDPTVLYLGTDLGVWRSADAGANWAHMGPEVGLPNVAITDLQANAGTDRLIAFTHGRGAFRLIGRPVTLSVTRTGGGTGTVQSADGGINCGTDCTQPYPVGTPVTLTPSAAAGSTFVGWSGTDPDCTGAGPITVTMSIDKTCQARFEPPVQLVVNRSGAGTVTSSPAGIMCGPTCSSNYAVGQQVTLTAQESAGTQFVGWTGCDTQTANGACVVTLVANRAVAAIFQSVYPSLSIQLNQTIFRAGDTLVATAVLLPGATPARADAYVALQLPGGEFLALALRGGAVAVEAAPPFLPIVSDVELMAVEAELLRYTFRGTEATGTYTWYTALMIPGTFTPLPGTQIQAAPSFTVNP